MDKKTLIEKGYKETENKVSIETACKKGLIIVLPIIILLVIIYVLVRGGYDFFANPWKDYFIVFGIFIVGFILHELIHILSFKLLGEKGKYEFSFDNNYLKPYCRSEEPIKVNIYRTCKGLPLLITGIIPYCISIITGSMLLMIASVILIGFCGVDIYILLGLTKVKGDSYILDDEYSYGYRILKK